MIILRGQFSSKGMRNKAVILQKFCHYVEGNIAMYIDQAPVKVHSEARDFFDSFLVFKAQFPYCLFIPSGKQLSLI